MENFTIVSTTTNVQAKQDVNGVTVNYNYNHEEGRAPLAVVFNSQREGGTLSGTYYADSKRFDVSNTKYRAGDATLTDAIFQTCEGIVDELKTKTDGDEEQD